MKNKYRKFHSSKMSLTELKNMIKDINLNDLYVDGVDSLVPESKFELLGESYTSFGIPYLYGISRADEYCPIIIFIYPESFEEARIYVPTEGNCVDRKIGVILDYSENKTYDLEICISEFLDLAER